MNGGGSIPRRVMVSHPNPFLRRFPSCGRVRCSNKGTSYLISLLDRSSSSSSSSSNIPDKNNNNPVLSSRLVTTPVLDIHPTIPTMNCHNHQVGRCFSTCSPDDSSPTISSNSELVEELQHLFNDIRMLAKNGQNKEAEKLLEEFQIAKGPLLSEELSADPSSNTINDLLRSCYNAILWGWSKGTDLNSAEHADRLLHSMMLSTAESTGSVGVHIPVEPNQLSYRYVLECWSRVKTKRFRFAGQRAERLLRRLQELGAQDQWAMYDCVLKACARSEDGERAIRILQEMIQQQNLGDGGEEGQISSLPDLNMHMISTVLIALKSQPERGEALLDQLHNSYEKGKNSDGIKRGVELDVIHYAMVIDAWSQQKNGPRTEALFNKMISRGIKPNVVACNSLLHAWSGDLSRMEQLFQAMIHDYLECPIRLNRSNDDDDDDDNQHDDDDADGHFRYDSKIDNGGANRPRAAVKPNTKSLSIVVAALAQANNPQRAEAVLSWVLNDARIRTIMQPNIVTWSSVINAWARARQPGKAEALLRRIQHAGFEPNVVTYTTVINAWARVGNAQRAQAIWDEMVHEHGIHPNLYSYSTLIVAYANAKQPEAAHQIMLTAMTEGNVPPDRACYGTVLKAWEEAKRPDKARQLLEEIRTREKREKNVELLDAMSYNTVLKAYSAQGMFVEVESLLEEMLRDDGTHFVRPTGYSFSLLFLAFSRAQDPRHREMAAAKAEIWFQRMLDMGLEPNHVTMNALLNCYSASGYPEKAESTLKQMLQSGTAQVDVVSYNTCIHAWARVGDAFRAEELLLDMIPDLTEERKRQHANKSLANSSIQPDTQSFSLVISAWAKQATMEAAENAEAILRHMHKIGKSCSRPDTVSYNTVLNTWMNVAHSGGSEDVARLCANRAEVLLSEMEFLKVTADHGDRVRPDRISYITMIRIWRAAGGNKKRVKELEEKIKALQHQNWTPSRHARRGGSSHGETTSSVS